MSNITQILNWISSSLLLPVTVLLLIGLACALVSLGGFFADSFILLKERKQRRKIMEALRRGEPVDIQQESGLFCERVRKLGELEWDELECEKIISEWEGLYERRLERSRFLAKVGPMLPDGTRVGGTRFRRHRLHGLQHADRFRDDRARLLHRRHQHSRPFRPKT